MYLVTGTAGDLEAPHLILDALARVLQRPLVLHIRPVVVLFNFLA